MNHFYLNYKENSRRRRLMYVTAGLDGWCTQRDGGEVASDEVMPGLGTIYGEPYSCTRPGYRSRDERPVENMVRRVDDEENLGIDWLVYRSQVS